ncbi:MAG: hypothetical protein PUG67_05765 [Peptoniphilaceae bacterium]|nr:hypothetical protein [Peptoniphilaceae bacterium]MDY6018988.1 hypothetical protein [Anaerococcus sp.]
MNRHIEEIIESAYSGEAITKEERQSMFSYFRHIPNARKTDKEFKLYCKMAKEKGIPKPERDSTIRPLYEYTTVSYRDENGKWRMKIINKE